MDVGLCDGAGAPALVSISNAETQIATRAASGPACAERATRQTPAACRKCSQLRAAQPLPLSAPTQLELPAIPPGVEREPPLPRHKRVPPPVHLMADIPATGGYRPVGDDTSLAPVLYAADASGFRRATNREIFVNAHELLKDRFRAGLPVTTHPELLRSFLQMKIGAQQCCVFLALFVTRDEMLIQVAELFRGTSSYVDIHPREVVRAAMECEAEGVICVRTDARGKSEATAHDISTAQWLKKLFDVMETPLMDYIVVGKGMTSLKRKGILRRDGACSHG